MAEKLKILLVDDHLLFLEALRNLLTVKGFEIVGTAHDGRDAVERARELRPDVVLMDIRMPRCNGLEATRIFRRELPEVKVVILTSSEDDDTLLEAIKSGASGYLVKSLKPDLFIALLSGVLRGEAPILREMASKVMEAFARQSQAPHPAETEGPPTTEPTNGKEAWHGAPSLTQRQLEIVKRVAQGQSYKEIAVDLGITKRTVQYHVLEIMQKLRLENRTQMIMYAAKAQLIDEEKELGEYHSPN